MKIASMFVMCVVVGMLAISPEVCLADNITGEKVIQNCIARYKEDMSEVQDMTVVTTRDVTYSKRISSEEEIVFKTRYETEANGQKFITVYDGKYLWQKDPMTGEVTKTEVKRNPYRMIEVLKSLPDPRYEGEEEVNGHKSYVVSVEDLTPLLGPSMLESVTRSEKVKEVKAHGKLWADAQMWVIRKVEVNIEVITEQGQEKDMDTTMRMEDFREKDGVLISYRRITTTQGASSMLSPEQEKKMRQQLEQMRQKIEQMPPDQREMAEQMMKSQIEKIKQALGVKEQVIEVKQVKVNTGLSDELFEISSP